MPRPRFLSTTFLLAMQLLAACYSPARAHAGMWTAYSNGNQVSGYELKESGASSLYDALVRTRGLYFSARGPSSLVDPPRDAILVFRAGMLMGDVDVLRMLRASDVRVVRRLNATETYNKYGRRVAVGGLELELVNE